MVRTEVPDPPGVNATGLVPKVKVRPVTAVAVDPANVMLPVNPRLFNVMVDVAEPPATKLEGVAAPALMVKSGVTVTETVAMWDGTPVPEPVTVMT